ncbi:MAG: DUF2283 domain-containing protein [Nanoarchaeota archaeon]|nr:DUF2283 domain-containing protein [Nanoarchaeota archaeon]
MERHLDAKGKGDYLYDFANDIMTFKIKNRDYKKSIDFDNIVIDFDTEEFITGIRVFDASIVFKLSKLQLKNISQFEFNASVEDKVISLQIRFISTMRNKPSVIHGQDFIREAVNSTIHNSHVLCTVS